MHVIPTLHEYDRYLHMHICIIMYTYKARALNSIGIARNLEKHIPVFVVTLTEVCIEFSFRDVTELIAIV